MKLEEWWDKLSVDFKQAPDTACPNKNLHVIGTCGKCKYWQIISTCSLRVGKWEKDDGCIDFEQKEGS